LHRNLRKKSRGVKDFPSRAWDPLYRISILFPQIYASRESFKKYSSKGMTKGIFPVECPGSFNQFSISVYLRKGKQG
jgi:hypothetical protein